MISIFILLKIYCPKTLCRMVFDIILVKIRLNNDFLNARCHTGKSLDYKIEISSGDRSIRTVF